MPALFRLGMHDALANAVSQLQPHEKVIAYLDDVYIVTRSEKARAVYDLSPALSASIQESSLIWEKTNADPLPATPLPQT